MGRGFSSAPALLAARARPSHIATLATLGKERDCWQSRCKRTIILANEWCKRAIILANYKQQVTLGQVSDLADKN